MSNLNGANHHNVEELLANIRSSFTDDPGHARSPLRSGSNAGLSNSATGNMPSHPAGQPAAHAQATYQAAYQTTQQSDTASGSGGVGPLRGAPPVHEDTSDFELPAIFKPGHQTHVERPNLFGRLSDALKSQHAVPTDAERSRTVIRFEPANGRMIEPPRAEPEMSSPQRGSAPPAPVPAPANVAAENVSVRREMPSFFDTRLKGLGQSAKPEPVFEPVPEPVAPPPPAPLPVAARDQNAHAARPPALPDGSMLMNNGAVEDAAAQMLRPILRQWLTENMPKIVEKALRSEAGDDAMPRPVDKDK